MMTDRELVDLLAVKVTGFTKCPNGRFVTDPLYCDFSFDPIRDARDTDRLIQAMRVMGWDIQSTQHHRYLEEAFVIFWKHGTEAIGHDSSWMRAVCLAAYGTTQVSVDD